jgi:hypothetical protein
VKHIWTAQTSTLDGAVQAQCRRCRIKRWRKFEGAVCITSWQRPSDRDKSYSPVPACRAAAAKKARAA